MDRKRWLACWMTSLLLLVPAAPIPAAEGQTAEDGISSTSVARLKIGKGTAWVWSGGSADWEEASDNFPLVEKSRVSVPRGSEAEILFRGSQSLHLGEEAEVDIRRLGEKEVSYRLRSGQAVLSLPKDDFAPVRITVPGNRVVRVDTPGRYSLDTGGGTTRFVVRSGEGTLADEDGSPIPVRAGEEATIGEGIHVGRATDGAAAEPVPEVTMTGPEKDAGVPPAVAGELRRYGEWVQTPEYGYAWKPYVEDGWEPYYYGRWAWVSPYGWTWVGYEPWGWWPYHTGRWWPSPVFGWVWCPFHSFASVNFVFGHSVFFGHHARFFPANVRFVGRDRFVRWVPLRPGERRSDSRTFTRGDSRLARWDRPVERGSVRVRRDGGQPAAWEGRSGRTRTATSGRGAGIPGADRSIAPSSGSRVRDGGAVRSHVSRGGSAGVGRPGSRGDGVPSVRRGRNSPAIIGNGGRSSGNFDGAGFRREPGRSLPSTAPSVRAGGMSRERGGSFSRGSAVMDRGGNRGNAGDFRGSRGGGNRDFGGGSRGSGRGR